jgi:hypothetical protein
MDEAGWIAQRQATGFGQSKRRAHEAHALTQRIER